MKLRDYTIVSKDNIAKLYPTFADKNKLQVFVDLLNKKVDERKTNKAAAEKKQEEEKTANKATFEKMDDAWKSAYIAGELGKHKVYMRTDKEHDKYDYDDIYEALPDIKKAIQSLDYNTRKILREKEVSIVLWKVSIRGDDQWVKVVDWKTI